MNDSRRERHRIQVENVPRNATLVTQVRGVFTVASESFPFGREIVTQISAAWIGSVPSSAWGTV